MDQWPRLPDSFEAVSTHSLQRLRKTRVFMILRTQVRVEETGPGRIRSSRRWTVFLRNSHNGVIIHLFSPSMDLRAVGGQGWSLTHLYDPLKPEPSVDSSTSPQNTGFQDFSLLL